MSKSRNVIQVKSFNFALRIITLVKFLEKEQKEYTISKQVMRSGTAVGAMIREAEHAESKKDFIHKMSISLKEANETRYWLDLLFESELISDFEINQVRDDCIELIRILASIVKSSKSNS
ncbi:MAG: four helix bundle protein [Bacteroidota bacterium]